MNSKHQGDPRIKEILARLALHSMWKPKYAQGEQQAAKEVLSGCCQLLKELPCTQSKAVNIAVDRYHFNYLNYLTWLRREPRRNDFCRACNELGKFKDT